MTGETNLAILIGTMKPYLNDGDYVFYSSKTADIDLSACLFFFREKEGITVVCKREYADSKGYTYNSIFSWITLSIHSALEAVGLTAAFSKALAEANISCNVVAGYYHDHIFVPKAHSEAGLAVLARLSKSQKDPSVKSSSKPY